MALAVAHALRGFEQSGSWRFELGAGSFARAPWLAKGVPRGVMVGGRVPRSYAEVVCAASGRNVDLAASVVRTQHVAVVQQAPVGFGLGQRWTHQGRNAEESNTMDTPKHISAASAAMEKSGMARRAVAAAWPSLRWWQVKARRGVRHWPLWLVVGVVAMLQVMGVSARLVGQTPAGGVRSPNASSATVLQGSDEPAELLREGTQLSEAVGHFRLSGSRVVFVLADGGRQLTVLENLTLERIAQMARDDGQRVVWTVSGLVTEYQGANYLLVRRARRRSVVVRRPASTAEEAGAAGSGVLERGERLDRPPGAGGELERRAR